MTDIQLTDHDLLIRVDERTKNILLELRESKAWEKAHDEDHQKGKNGLIATLVTALSSAVLAILAILTGK